jgi:Flp pilus assembly pilin Flp
MIQNFFNDEGGASGIEYSLIAITLIGTMFVFFWWWGDVFVWGFTTMADCIQTSFEASCYSEHANRGVPNRDGEPMWWPRE